jgi:hypothetical protein
MQIVGPEDIKYEGPLWKAGGAHVSVEELKQEALRLSPEARAYLARELLASLDAMSEAEIEKLWMDEAIRRDEELDSGAARAYPADEVLARVRARRK